MLYIIGLGLNENGISLEGLSVLKKCKKIFLEDYTIDFPYDIKTLEKSLKKKIALANRDFVEKMDFLLEARKIDVALLVYGSPLVATTHITILQEAKRQKIKYKVIHNASVFDSVAETGLQIYKFGKVTSLPKWQKGFEPTSFMEVIKENQSINAHSLILVDIDLRLEDALKELEISTEKQGVKIEKFVVCSRLGTKDSKIYYKYIEDLKKLKIKTPFCFIIPGKMHFVESDFLKGFS
jgi:diphthine synthase